MRPIGMLKIEQALLPSRCRIHWVKQDGRYMCSSTAAESGENRSHSYSYTYSYTPISSCQGSSTAVS
jgi:hypothetical protein